MKRVAVIVLLMMYVSACGKPAIEQSESVCDRYEILNQSSGGHMAEIEDGFYALMSSRLYYADKIDMQWVILCNRPECTHVEVENCNAYAESPFTISNDMIYHSQQAVGIVRMKLNGLDHEFLGDVSAIMEPSDGRIRGTFNIFDARGMRYYAYCAFDEVEVDTPREVFVWRTYPDLSQEPQFLMKLESEGTFWVRVIPGEREDGIGIETEVLKNGRMVKNYYLYNLIDNSMQQIMEDINCNKIWLGKDYAYYFVSADGFYRWEYEAAVSEKLADVTYDNQKYAAYGAELICVWDESRERYVFYDQQGVYLQEFMPDLKGQSDVFFRGFSQELVFFNTISYLADGGVIEKILYLKQEEIKNTNLTVYGEE